MANEERIDRIMRAALTNFRAAAEAPDRSERIRALLDELSASERDSVSLLDDSASARIAEVRRQILRSYRDRKRIPRPPLIGAFLASVRMRFGRSRGRLAGRLALVMQAATLAGNTMVALMALAAGLFSMTGTAPAAAVTVLEHPSVAAARLNADAIAPATTPVPGQGGLFLSARFGHAADVSGAVEVKVTRREIRIERSVTVAGHTVGEEGTLLWIECDPESTVERVLCDAWDRLPQEAGGGG